MPRPTTTTLARPLGVRTVVLVAVAALALAAPLGSPHPAVAVPVPAGPTTDAGLAASAASPASQARLTSRLSSILNDVRSRTESDVSVLDAETGAVVYSRRSTSPNMPASNTKILTAAAAMHVLGPDYRF